MVEGWESKTDTKQHQNTFVVQFAISIISDSAFNAAKPTYGMIAHHNGETKTLT